MRRKIEMVKYYDANNMLMSIEFEPEECPFCPDPDEAPMPRCRTIDVYAEEGGGMVNCPFCYGIYEDNHVYCACTDGNQFAGWENYKYGAPTLTGVPVSEEDPITE